MVDEIYIPEKGDVVWLNFDPTIGHEQKGRRPAIVLSSLEYNHKSNLALFCPITSTVKNYPFEVKVDTDYVKGVVLCDQVKNFDWTKRNIGFVCKLDSGDMNEIIQKISSLIIN